MQCLVARKCLPEDAEDVDDFAHIFVCITQQATMQASMQKGAKESQVSFQIELFRMLRVQHGRAEGSCCRVYEPDDAQSRFEKMAYLMS